VLPSIFALVIGPNEARSPSLYPGNPDSTHYDPQLYAQANGSDHEDNRVENAAEDEEAPETRT
jgi:hypothetical protein